jgi:hypothetical protein
VNCGGQRAGYLRGQDPLDNLQMVTRGGKPQRGTAGGRAPREIMAGTSRTGPAASQLAISNLAMTPRATPQAKHGHNQQDRAG